MYASGLVVAPFAGAWIETISDIYGIDCEFVAPFAGAWIETVLDEYDPECDDVAPFAGAWIETILMKKGGLVWLSHPSRVRGLKPTAFK